MAFMIVDTDSDNIKYALGPGVGCALFSKQKKFQSFTSSDLYPFFINYNVQIK